MNIVTIQFTTAGKLYDFLVDDLPLSVGERVIVETERGKSIAKVAIPPRPLSPETPTEGMKRVQRKATEEEIASLSRSAIQEREARRYCIQKIRERNLEMKLVSCEYQYDGSKAIFYFTAEGRIDFRELVKDLAHHLRVRIEMRQIGVRDEAKLVGGIGICGRELCCSTFLREFAPVSVKMAKEQNLALNPTKISGQCGRLLCCLGYEYESYAELKKGLPKCGKTISCGENCRGEVVKQNILRQTVTVRTENQKEITLTREELESFASPSDPPPQPLSSAEKSEKRSGKKSHREPTPNGPSPSPPPLADATEPRQEVSPHRPSSKRRSKRHGKKSGQENHPPSEKERP